MIIWAGYGFIVFIIVIVDSLIAELITEAITHNSHFYEQNLDPLGISLMVSGIVVYGLQNYFDRKRAKNEGTRIFDKVTIANKGHHLFFIPFAYWTYVLMVTGVIMIACQSFRSR
jgi:hypothetical protein